MNLPFCVEFSYLKFSPAKNFNSDLILLNKFVIKEQLAPIHQLLKYLHCTVYDTGEKNLKIMFIDHF